MVSGIIISSTARASSFFKTAPITWAPFCKELRTGKAGTVITTGACMRARSRIMRPTEVVFITIRIKGMSIMASGRMTCPMARVRKSSKMAPTMKATSFMESSRGLGIMCAVQAFSRASSQMATFMEMVFSRMSITGSTMGSGRMGLLKGSECLHGRMATGTKVSI
jgi:hypothetical protein